MRIAIASFLAAAALSLVVAPPALAQMKTSVPAKPQTLSPAAGGNPHLTFWPGPVVTGMSGLEEARVMSSGKALYTIGGLNFGFGLGGNLEGRGNFGLTLNTTPFTWTVSPAASAKYVFMNAGNMSAAAGGALGVSSSAATPFDLFGAVYLPISFWKLGPGDLHVVPALAVPTVTTTGAFAAPLGLVNVTAGYTMPLTQKFTLVVTDTLTLAFANTLAVGGRVGFTPNLTLDVVPIRLGGANLSLGLLGVTGYWGSSLGDLTKGLGL